MTGASVARQGELDHVLGTLEPTSALAQELFGVADTLEDSPQLRRALTDPAADAKLRGNLVGDLFGGKVSADTLRVAQAAVGLAWPSGGSLSSALERQAVRALLLLAHRAGKLTEVEEQLFAFGRVVQSEDALRRALADRRVPAANRVRLVEDLLKSKALPETIALANRAVLAKDRTFALTVEHYLNLAAGLRDREVAVVHVAKPLGADQTERLLKGLAKVAGREVNLEVIVDASIQGGVRVEWADEVIEGTIAGRLEAARRQLT